jgi:hypothetical protein
MLQGMVQASLVALETVWAGTYTDDPAPVLLVRTIQSTMILVLVSDGPPGNNMKEVV